MRRTAVQNLRFLRRPVLRKTVKSRLGNPTASIACGQRYIASRSGPGPSQMRGRRVSQALLAGAVAGGAWYAMQGATGSNKVTLLESPAGNKFPQPEPIQEAVQKALIVERGELYTSVIPEGQVFKDTDDAGRRVIKMLTEDQVTAKLRKKEMSYNVGRGRGVVRYDVVQLPSNDPIEDDHAEKIVDVPSTDDTASGSDWMFWGVFDGHSGWTTSAKLRQSLISFVARELNSTYRSASKSVPSLFPSAEAIDDAIKKGFTKLDHEITHESVQRVLKAQSKPLAAELLAPALSGSCALLSFYDSRSKELRVACTGDSRAVLGRRSANGKWTATPLSTDFTGGTESEAARLRAEHPNEPYVTANGRILGSLEPSRAFGDASYKWSLELQSKLHGTYFARRPNPRLKTPPYVTAEPIVTTTQIAPEKGDFVVMATDGLWEMLTNEEVIGLVGMWLEKNPLNAAHPKPASGLKAWLPSFLAPSAALPVEASGGASDASGQRAPIRLAQYGIDPEQSGRFVVDDANAATHLVRNALGGANKDMVSALLTLAAPNSRRYRDDLTVEVIFFGEEGEASRTGRVEVNAEGSKGKTAEGVKAKL